MCLVLALIVSATSTADAQLFFKIHKITLTLNTPCHFDFFGVTFNRTELFKLTLCELRRLMF